eukprot:scaffold93060_cov33-Prasinocladus_malaysianus.AAC.1
MEAWSLDHRNYPLRWLFAGSRAVGDVWLQLHGLGVWAGRDGEDVNALRQGPLALAVRPQLP